MTIFKFLKRHKDLVKGCYLQASSPIKFWTVNIMIWHFNLKAFPKSHKSILNRIKLWSEHFGQNLSCPTRVICNRAFCELNRQNLEVQSTCLMPFSLLLKIDQIRVCWLMQGTANWHRQNLEVQSTCLMPFSLLLKIDQIRVCWLMQGTANCVLRLIQEPFCLRELPVMPDPRYRLPTPKWPFSSFWRGTRT